MILDVRDPDFRPHKVFDSFGGLLELVSWADTQTGEIEQLALDDRGKVVLLGLDRFKTVRWVVPSGIRAEPVAAPPE